MEYSSLIGKPVLNPSGKRDGYVLKAYLTKDLSALSCLRCADEEEEEFFVPAHAVKKIGEAIVAGRARLKSPTGIPCPVGCAAFDEYGAFLGVVSSLTDGEEGILTVSGVLSEREFPAKQVFAGQSVLISYPPKSPKTPKRTGETAPRFRTDLLGKKVKREIEGLARAGETVTCELLRRAGENNRLLELSAAVLTQ